MKNICSFLPDKYFSDDFEPIEDGVYKHNNVFVTSLSFQQEPEFGEGIYSDNISQYPLEDILDKFFVYVTDFYDELNTTKSNICYLEFGSPQRASVQSLRSIIGKHVYNRVLSGKDAVKLVIE